MPFFRSGDKLIYFIHVPKCAGTSVEFYLAERFGPLAFKDSEHYRRPERERWSKSSPQHVLLPDLTRLVPLEMFDAMFAVVRHPVDRMASAYLFKREVERQVPPEMSFDAWLDGLEAVRAEDPYALDNHVCAAVEFVPEEGAAVFRLEDGLGALVEWLDTQVGSADGPREIGHKQNRANWYARRNKPTAEFSVGPEARARIREMYALDFERFGYGIDDETAY
ncbi:sulfotransferase family protein [Jannaschia seohaensis]|uniref:Sulfotransferase family protein n=1 Tax=Jannaschia seohaensis TaxID=475081 RepID=A0A2Y9B295_9RHOB|nr:sulfotransferase family protein [Jannaschia seohaensis]PWJ13245.1 sulfotransferase family protein [Jannaschia seohaensis]SSA50571.1 Sulfotransferase family protein [Jannaschia seohaensis]